VSSIVPTTGAWHAGSAYGGPYPGTPVPRTPWTGLRPQRRWVARDPPPVGDATLGGLGCATWASQRVVDHRGASRSIFTTGASTASPPRIEWQPASCPNDVCGAGVFDTQRMTASSQGTWALGTRAMLQPWVAPTDRRTLVVRKTMMGPGREPPFLPPVVVGNEDEGGAKDRGVAGGRQGPRRQHQPSP
jgi:hypothetical protein